MKHFFLSLLCLLVTSLTMATTHTITNSGITFVPFQLNIAQGDTVIWNIGGSHDVIEVDSTTWANNMAIPNGGFSTPFGGGTVVFNTVGTFYYVCTPHAGLGMKGEINVNPSVKNVTFQVDMRGYQGTENFGVTGVFLNGSFNGWCGNCAQMSDANMDSIYDITIPLNDGTYEYKFTIGGWTDQEDITLTDGSCAISAGGFTNRIVSINSDSTIADVCWNSCQDCANTVPATLQNVTFEVDMRGYQGTLDFGTQGVFLNGGFNSWCGSCNPMTDTNNDSIYDVTIQLYTGTIEYKFTIGGWNDQEDLTLADTTCTLTTGAFTNRVFTFGSDTAIGAVCWESCNPCASVPATSNITFAVDMSQYTDTFDFVTQGVFVNGTWNNWCGNCNPMTDVNGDSIYTVTLPITNGNHDFKYTIGGWNDEEDMTLADGSCTVTTAGFTNRTESFTADETLDTVCWESCQPCGIVVTPPDTADITFQVDMRGYQGTLDYGAQGVFVNGTFNGWCGSCNPMTDVNGDSIYSLTIPLVADTIEYKFTVGGWNDQEDMTLADSSCTITSAGFTNRILEFASDTTIDTVCWESCQTCVPDTSAPAATANVTFQVDMRGYQGVVDFGTQGVFVNGTFNGWCGSCNPMTDVNGDSIYTLTIPLTVNTIEYKYTVGGWTDQEDMTLANGNCTITTAGFTNRILEFAADTTIDTVCWQSCQGCASTVLPTIANVTFQVDMNGYQDTLDFVAEGVFVNGTFNGWCGSCNPMTDVNGDSIYSLTIPLVADTIEYKFTVGGWNDQEDMTLADSSCTITSAGFTNRILEFASDTTIDTVCWESCQTCVPDTSAPAATSNVTFVVDMNGYQGTVDFVATGVYVNGTWNAWCGTCNPMTDLNGDSIYSVTLPITDGTHEFKFTVDGWADDEDLTLTDGSCTVSAAGFTNRVVNINMDMVMDTVCWESCQSCDGVGLCDGVVPDQDILDDYECQANITYTFANATWTEDVLNPMPSGINTSSRVGEFIHWGANTDGAFGGSLDLSPISLTNDNQIKIDILTNASSLPIILVLQDGGGNDLASATEVTPAPSAWGTITFDMSAATNETDIANIVFVVNPGSTVQDTVYFDNIRLDGFKSDPCAGVVPDATIMEDFDCQRNLDYQFAEGGFVTIPNPDPSGINSSANVGEYTRNNTVADAFGGDFTLAPLDFGTFNFVSMMVWDANAPSDVTIVLQDAAGADVGSALASTSVGNTWEDLAFDFSSVPNAAGVSKVVLLFDAGNQADSGNVYFFDNFRMGGGTSIDNVKDITELIVYPNPVQDQLNIKLAGLELEEDGLMRITSVDGRVVVVQGVSRSTEVQTIDVANLSSGQYFIEITANGLSASGSFTK